MWYMIVAEDHEDSLEKRLGAHEAHLARLQTLLDDGRLMLAGPLPAVDSEEPGAAGFTGSLLVVEFASLEDAKSWADKDPYIAAGVYKNVTVKPFRRGLP
ncbi:MAG: YciI family protein [Woeseiaceae bacterium]